MLPQLFAWLALLLPRDVRIDYHRVPKQSISFVGGSSSSPSADIGEDVYIARLVGADVPGHPLLSSSGKEVVIPYTRTTHAEAEAKGVYRQSAASHPITDLAECLFACRHNSLCAGFVDHFEDFGKTMCELKTSVQMENIDRGATTDYYLVPSDYFILQKGIDFPGGDIRNMDGPPSASVTHPARRYYNSTDGSLVNPQAACAVACLQDVTCLGYIDVHHGESGSVGDEPFCLLKDALNETCCENNYTHLATNFYRKSPAIVARELAGSANSSAGGKQRQQHERQQAAKEESKRTEAAQQDSKSKSRTSDRNASSSHTLLSLLALPEHQSLQPTRLIKHQQRDALRYGEHSHGFAPK